MILQRDCHNREDLIEISILTKSVIKKTKNKQTKKPCYIHVYNVSIKNKSFEIIREK